MKPYQAKIQYGRTLGPVFDVSDGSAELDVEPSFVHNYAGVVFFNDSAGETYVQPSTGTATFTAKLVVQPHDFQEVPNNELDVSAPDQVDWSGNTETVRVVLSDVTGATHARLIVAGNSA